MAALGVCGSGTDNTVYNPRIPLQSWVLFALQEGLKKVVMRYLSQTKNEYDTVCLLKLDVFDQKAQI